jgi:hypothetical protein
LLLLPLVIESKGSGFKKTPNAQRPTPKGEDIGGMQRSLGRVSSAEKFRERLHRFNMGAENLESGQDWNS